MEIIIIMGFLFIFFTVVYVVLAIYAPEWVGITGHKAHEINRSHHTDQKNEEEPPEIPKKDQ
jgi:hypothetical protein